MVELSEATKLQMAEAIYVVLSRLEENGNHDTRDTTDGKTLSRKSITSFADARHCLELWKKLLQKKQQVLSKPDSIAVEKVLDEYFEPIMQPHDPTPSQGQCK